MKKIFVICLFQFTAIGAFAQAGAASASLQAGKLDDAKNQIDKAITNEKQAAKASTWIYRGDIYRDIANSQLPIYSALDTNAVQVAYDAYKKAASLDPKKAEEANKKITELQPTIMNTAVKRYQNKQMEPAAKYADMARMINPKDTLAALVSGIAYQTMQNNDKALESFQSLIDIGTNDPSIYLTVYQMQRNAKNNDKALEVLKKGIAKFPNSKDMKQQEFNLYLETGKSQEAITSLEAQLKADPNNAEYMKNLGILYDQSGDKKKALEYYEKALAADPSNYDANFNVGVLQYNKGAELSTKIRNMDLKVYQRDGKRLETEMKGYFQKALPYFEKCYAAKQDDKNVLDPLKSIYTVLERKADADKVEKALQKL